MIKPNQYQQELLTMLQTAAKDKKLLDAVLQDLLTPKEYREITKRWQIIKQLAKHIPQREIAKNLKVSIAKITRGSRELQDPEGGFKKILKLRKIIYAEKIKN